MRVRVLRTSLVRLSCVSGQQVGFAVKENSDHLFPVLSVLSWATVTSPLDHSSLLFPGFPASAPSPTPQSILWAWARGVLLEPRPDQAPTSE